MQKSVIALEITETVESEGLNSSVFETLPECAVRWMQIELIVTEDKTNVIFICYFRAIAE